MRIALTLLLLAAAATLPLRAQAFDLEENLKAQHEQYAVPSQMLMVQREDCLSLSQATASVRGRLRPGDRILSAETRIQGGREVHHIKVLTRDGKVRTHRVNGCRR